MKVGLLPVSEDLRRVQATREAIGQIPVVSNLIKWSLCMSAGPNIKLMVDANHAYSVGKLRLWNGGRIAKRNRGKTCGKRLQKIVNETDILVKVQANLSYIHNHHHSLQEHFWWHCSYPQPHSWCPWQDRGESILKNTLCVLIWLLNYFNSNYLKSPCISVDCCCIHQSCWCCCWLGWGAKFPPWHPASLVSKYFQ